LLKPEFCCTTTNSNNSIPALKSKHVLGAGSHKLESTVPETLTPSQLPPSSVISHASPSDNPSKMIVPSATLAGSSPTTVPPEVVVTSVIVASEPV